MIGSLQRQLDGASRKLGAGGVPGAAWSVDDNNNDGGPTGATMKTGDTAAQKTKTAKGASKSGASKVRSTADRTSKRASKSAVAKKSAGRARSGASRKAAKSSR
jgi:hypothetical protein